MEKNFGNPNAINRILPAIIEYMRRLDFYTIAVSSAKHQKKYLNAFQNVLKRGIYLRGPENKKLTTLLSKKIGAPVISVASGHDALLLTLQSLHLQPSDEVIIPANAYPTAFAAALCGAKLTLVDVDKNGQLASSTVANAINRHTKAVIMVHLYGATGDIDAIDLLCKQKGIILIEDCAQAFGTTYKNKYVGTIGTVGCFSFYPTKNLGSFGDGGAISTKNKSLCIEIQKRTLYGETTRYNSTLIAGHSNLPELQAAGLIISLRNADTILRAKKQVASWYMEAIQRLSPRVVPLVSDEASTPALHLFVVRATRRDALRQSLAKRHIPTYIHYPTPVHLVPSFAHLGYKRGSFPNTELLAKEIISLPFHASMTKKDVLTVIHTISKFYTSF